MTLIGPKRLFSPIQAWFEAFQQGSPSVYPLILVGDSGTGKTFLANHFATKNGFDVIESHAEEARTSQSFKRLFGDARMPTFFGQRRCVVVEDIDSISKRDWNEFDEPIRAKAFPLVIIADSEASIAWKYRRGGLVHQVHSPSIESLREHLLGLFPDGDHEHIDWCARNATTWRGSEILFKTTPVGWSARPQRFPPSRIGHAEVEAILQGRNEGGFSSHPLAIMQTADFNGVNPHHLIRAMELHSKSWSADLLGSISRAYLGTLRTKSWDKPPFRKRELKKSFLVK